MHTYKDCNEGMLRTTLQWRASLLEGSPLLAVHSCQRHNAQLLLSSQCPRATTIQPDNHKASSWA